MHRYLSGRSHFHLASLTALCAGGIGTAATASPMTVALIRQAPDTACAMTLDGARLTIVTKSIAGSAVAYHWVAPGAGAANWLGTLDADVGYSKAFSWNDDSALKWIKPATLKSAAWTAGKSEATLALAYQTVDGPAQIVVHVGCNGPSLVIGMTSDKPWLAEARFWTLNKGPRVARLDVPYNPFEVDRTTSGNIFTSSYFDFTEAKAASQYYPSLTWPALTDGSRLTPDERLVVAVSPTLADVFAPQVNPPSPYLADLSGRMVLDIWDFSKGFAYVKAGLDRITGIGVGPCAIIIHNWQHYGFDYGIPQVLPADPKFGGDPGLIQVADAARAIGCRLALHQTYVDTYPNYPKFSFDDIIRTADGAPGPGWLNRRVNVRAYATRPDRFVAQAETQAPEVHARFGTTAGYIDQNSGMRPTWRVDLAAGRPGAGTFMPFVQNSIALWDYQRKANGGPVFGEGLYNFFWAGRVDAVEAQLDPRISDDNVHMPLLVDFALRRIHQNSADHGMGYYDRWTAAYLANRGPEHLAMQDIYRMQEIAFGHAPFLSGVDWGDPESAWTESNLVGPVAKRYGAVKPTSILYLVGGKWQPVEAAIAHASLATVKVVYANGLEIVANSAEVVLPSHGFVLPRGGWSAMGSDIEAASGMLGGARVDFVDTPDQVFASVRGTPSAPVTLGPVTTDGSVSLKHAAGMWTLRTLAARPTTTIRLAKARFAMPASVTRACPGGGAIRPVAEGDGWSFNRNGCNSYTWSG